MSESTVRVDTISSYASSNIVLSTADVTRVAISGLATGSIYGITASLPVQISGLVTCLAGMTVSSGQFASSAAAPTQPHHLCNKTYVDGKGAAQVATWTTTASTVTSTVFPYTYIFPANTFLIYGHCLHAMTSNNGSRLDAQFYNGATAVGVLMAVCGGNEIPGGDGGRGMTIRPNFMIGVPVGADRVTFSRGVTATPQAGIAGNGSGGMTLLINQTVVIS